MGLKLSQWLIDYSPSLCSIFFSTSYRQDKFWVQDFVSGLMSLSLHRETWVRLFLMRNYRDWISLFAWWWVIAVIVKWCGKTQPICRKHHLMGWAFDCVRVKYPSIAKASRNHNDICLSMLLNVGSCGMWLGAQVSVLASLKWWTWVELEILNQINPKLFSVLLLLSGFYHSDRNLTWTYEMV
jgi:hypothetical protein